MPGESLVCLFLRFRIHTRENKRTKLQNMPYEADEHPRILDLNDLRER